MEKQDRKQDGKPSNAPPQRAAQFAHPLESGNRRAGGSDAEDGAVRRIDRPSMVSQEFLRHELDDPDGKDQKDPRLADAGNTPARQPIQKQIGDIGQPGSKGDDKKQSRGIRPAPEKVLPIGSFEQDAYKGGREKSACAQRRQKPAPPAHPNWPVTIAFEFFSHRATIIPIMSGL